MLSRHEFTFITGEINSSGQDEKYLEIVLYSPETFGNYLAARCCLKTLPNINRYYYRKFFFFPNSFKFIVPLYDVLLLYFLLSNFTDLFDLFFI